MKKFQKIFFFFLLSTSALCAEVSVKIVQPYDNSTFPHIKKSFVFGSVTPATATLKVNGIDVQPTSNGGFLVMIPFEEGKFKIEAVATDGVSISTATRFVNVRAPASSYPENFKKIEVINPKSKIVVRPGDSIPVAFQSAPGGVATFRVDDSNPISMEEQPGEIQGIYKAVFIAQPEDKFNDADIFFSLKRKDGVKISGKSGSKITIQRRRNPRMLEIKENSILLTAPDSDSGYNLFLYPGTKMEIVGEWGDFYKVSAGESCVGWVKKIFTTELPIGAYPPKSTSRNLRISTTSMNSTIVEIPLQNKHAFRIEQMTHPHTIRLTLFGVTADSDRIRYRGKDSTIREVTWQQDDSNTCTFNIYTDQRISWGYDVRYEGNSLVLELRHRPKTYNIKGLPLKGIRVVVDAGHSFSSFGTIGPLGNTEASISLKVANTAKNELEKKGAEVILTQDGTKELSLNDRVVHAWNARGDLFISIHADACAEGQNPNEIEGYSVHYFHPQSRKLAEIIHRIYGQKTAFRDQGLWRSNLAVCRMTQMPSILLEQGFLILPQFEEIMLSQKHQQDVAEILTQSIIDLLDQP
ncbi:MAG: N-acetylmuramoyl-L-alanine amidase [Elusimicrobiota bacterium]